MYNNIRNSTAQKSLIKKKCMIRLDHGHYAPSDIGMFFEGKERRGYRKKSRKGRGSVGATNAVLLTCSKSGGGRACSKVLCVIIVVTVAVA